MRRRVLHIIEIVAATIIGVLYSMILLITFIIATQAIADILDWARTEIRKVAS